MARSLPAPACAVLSFVGLLLAAPARAAGHEAAAGLPMGWRDQVLQALQRAEFEARRSETGYEAANRAHGWRARFGPKGLELVPSDEGAWSLTLALRSVDGREADLALPQARGPRVEYRRAGLTEWYLNDPRGLEQGFDVATPVAGGELRLVLDVAARGLALRLAAGGQALAFEDDAGHAVLSYSSLRSWDAGGRELPSRLVVEGCDGPSSCRLALVVDTRGARYPVTIDPLLSASWSFQPDQDGALVGSAVAAGDVNGDGFSDVVVGASSYDGGQADEGRVYVFYGSSAGPAAAPSWIEECDQAAAGYGAAVAVGDVNGDGYADLAVGAPFFDNGQTDEGRVFVYLGSPGGLSHTVAFSAESNQTGARLGDSVAVADLDGNGYAEVAAGAPSFDGAVTDAGRVLVYNGTAGGPSSSLPDVIDGTQGAANFGGSLASAGDVDGDGYGDLLVGASLHDEGQTSEGKAFLYRGTSVGVATSPAWSVQGNQASAFLGLSLDGAGDVDGDGYADVIVGAEGYDGALSDEGRAQVFLGSATGLAASPAWTQLGGQAGARLGSSVARAGDVDGDGYGDVVVGARLWDGGLTDEGSLRLFHGSSTGPSLTPAAIEGNLAGLQLGELVAAGGDVDGDGYADVLAGTRLYDGPEVNEGRASLYRGCASTLGQASAWGFEADQAGAEVGASVASAGDVNRDGYDDVIVGAPKFDNGETDEGRAFVFHGSASGLSVTPNWTAESNLANGRFGAAVAGVGDLNGDGYADVAVGAPGGAWAGAVYVYHGSASGLPATATLVLHAVGSTQPTEFGGALAAAGDVNGDGFGDLVVGANNYMDGELAEGAAFVYAGSPSGLASTPLWSVQSNDVGAHFGSAVDGAGDVNGDGYADVIVGAANTDLGGSDRGRVHLYHGSASGPLTAWTFEGDADNGYLGRAVAGVGDLDADGYSDVVVGAPFYTNGQSNEGRVYVFRGSPVGLPPAPSQTLESGASFAFLGSSLSAAGDVNGDGYADVLVGRHGTPDTQSAEGVVYLYRGYAGGLFPLPYWTFEGNQDQAKAYVAAGAGDVDGDGFADVLRGAPALDAGQVDEGQALLFRGHEATGRLRRWLQARGGSGTPVQAWGHSFDGDAFRVRVYGTSPAGRARVRVEVEACPPRAPFGTSSCLRSVQPAWTDVGASATGPVLSHTVGGLASGQLYRWRARLQYAPIVLSPLSTAVPPPSPSHGPWRRFRAQVAEGDLRVGREADLALSLADGTTVAVPGGTLSYTATASNAGPSPALATAFVSFPASLTCSWTCAGQSGGTCTAGPVAGAVVDTASLPVGGSAVYTLTCGVAQAATGSLQVSGTTYPLNGLVDPFLANNSPSDTNLVQPTSDLAVDVDDGLGTAVPGTPVVYSVVVSATGPTNVGGASVSAPLPSALTSGSWTCAASPGSSCSPGPVAGGIADSVSLAAGGSLTYTLAASVRPDAVGTVTLAASVGAPSVLDPQPANNGDSDSDTLTPSTDLSAGLSAGPDPVPVYGLVEYALQAANSGPSDATAVVLTHELPPGLAFESASGGCTHAAGTVTCAVGELASGASAGFGVKARALAGTVGDQASQAAVAGAESDPDPADNGDSATTRVLFRKGDFDNDLNTDLLLRHLPSGQNVAWLMNGAARVAPVLASPTPAGLDWQVAGVDDFNADQRNDLALWNSVSGAVEFWFLDGSANVARVGAAVPLTGGAAPPPWRLAATADFDHDARPDLVWRNASTQKIEIWTMNGTARVGTVIPTPDQAVDANWEIVAAFDWNADQNTDFLWYNPVSGKIVLWFMDASVVRITGTFTTPSNAGDANWKVLAAGDYGIGPLGVPESKDIVWRNLVSGRFVVWFMDQAGSRTFGTFTSPDAPVDPLSWTIVGPR